MITETLSLLTLIAALHAVESDYGRDPKCHGNQLQLTRSFVDDTNRIVGGQLFLHEDVYNFDLSVVMTIMWLSYHREKYEATTNKPATYEVLAKIFHLGWRGFRDPKKAKRGNRYWGKVSDVLDREWKICNN